MPRSASAASESLSSGPGVALVSASGGEGTEGLAPLRGHRVAEADIDEGTAGERGIKDVASEAAVDHLAEDDAEDDADDRHPEGDRRWQREGVEQGRDEDRRRDRLAARPGEGRFGEVRGGADRQGQRRDAPAEERDGEGQQRCAGVKHVPHRPLPVDPLHVLRHLPSH